MMPSLTVEGRGCYTEQEVLRESVALQRRSGNLLVSVAGPVLAVLFIWFVSGWRWAVATAGLCLFVAMLYRYAIEPARLRRTLAKLGRSHEIVLRVGPAGVESVALLPGGERSSSHVAWSAVRQVLERPGGRALRLDRSAVIIPRRFFGSESEWEAVLAHLQRVEAAESASSDPEPAVLAEWPPEGIDGPVARVRVGVWETAAVSHLDESLRYCRQPATLLGWLLIAGLLVAGVLWVWHSASVWLAVILVSLYAGMALMAVLGPILLGVLMLSMNRGAMVERTFLFHSEAVFLKMHDAQARLTWSDLSGFRVTRRHIMLHLAGQHGSVLVPRRHFASPAEADRAVAIIRANLGRCPRCEYPRRGVSGDACPECGSPWGCPVTVDAAERI